MGDGVMCEGVPVGTAGLVTTCCVSEEEEEEG